MHLEQLRYFALLYQNRSISRAARLIPMSPQGLMKSIRSLEAELGVPLFNDENGIVTPTVYSDTLREYTKRWESDFLFLSSEFERLKAQERCEIRLGTSLGIIGFMGSSFIDKFLEKHPNTTISYNELSDAFCDASLLNGTYDLAFTLAPYDNRFTTVELYKTQVYFWVNTKAGYTQGDTLSAHDFSGKNVAMPGEDFKIYNTIQTMCKANNVELNYVFTSHEIFWLYEFVAENRGIAFTLPHLKGLSTFASNEDVIALPLEGIYWRFGISHLSTHKLMPYEKQFLEFVEAYRTHLYPG